MVPSAGALPMGADGRRPTVPGSIDHVEWLFEPVQKGTSAALTSSRSRLTGSIRIAQWGCSSSRNPAWAIFSAQAQ
jgi:hypothetical protein